MTCRDLRKQDLVECLEIAPAHIGDELVGRAHAIRAWETLIRSRAFNTAVIEAESPIAGHTIAAFGASLFVSRAFAGEEISNPRPGLNSRIIASIHSRRAVILSEAEIRSANTKGGLDVVILYNSYSRGILGVETGYELLTLLALRFVELHAGYRMNQLIVEVTDQEERQCFEATHAWRVISSFDEFHLRQPDNRWNRDRALAVITRTDALSALGSLVSSLFHDREPVLGLRDADQQLLIAALKGPTNQELSQQLKISLPAVKKRWASLFERTINARPDLFPGLDETPGDNKRGEQKRHHVLAYMRSHPQELRPIERASHADRHEKSAKRLRSRT